MNNQDAKVINKIDSKTVVEIFRKHFSDKVIIDLCGKSTKDVEKYIIKVNDDPKYIFIVNDKYSMKQVQSGTSRVIACDFVVINEGVSIGLNREGTKHNCQSIEAQIIGYKLILENRGDPKCLICYDEIEFDDETENHYFVRCNICGKGICNKCMDKLEKNLMRNPSEKIVKCPNCRNAIMSIPE